MCPRVTFIVSFILAASWAGAQEAAPPLTLDDCIRRAMASPSALSLARQQSQIAALSRTTAKAALLPQARLGAAFTYNSPLSGTSEVQSYVALNGIREYSALLTAIQEIDISGRLRAARARARAEEDGATANVRLAERDLKRAVTRAYYRALLGRRLVVVANDALAEARRFETRARQLEGKGEAARADVVKASALTAFLEQTVTAAELEAETASHDLASFWTADVQGSLPLADTLDAPVPPPDQAHAPPEKPFLRRLEFDVLDAERRGFLAEARRLHGERLPQATFALQWGLDSTRVHFGDRGYAALFDLSVPIFDWRKARSASRQLELQAEQVEETREITVRAFSREYQDALAAVEKLHAQIATTERQVALSNEDLRLARIRYEGGEGSALDVVTAQGQLAQARTNHYTTLARYLQSRAELTVAAGE